MKKLSTILLLALFLINIQCGGGGDRTHSGTTPVSIKVTEFKGATGPDADQLSGAVRTHDLASAVEEGEGEGRQLSLCRITITGPGMTDMVRDVDIAGKSSIKETFNVPSGVNRSFLIQMFIENNDTVIIQALSEGNDLKGKYLEIPMEPKKQDDYYEPPDFAGILSVNNSETRSVMLNWKPATDNITDQKRIQYLIYLTTGTKRDQAEENDIFVLYELGKGTERDEDPLMTYTYDGDEIILISYEYVGAVPEDVSTLSEEESQQISTDRLDPGVPYYFLVRASDEWGFKEDNLVESEQIVVYMLDMEVQGSGTVTSQPAGINCGEKCSEDYLRGTGVTLTAAADEGAVFNGWTGCENDVGTGGCLITLTQNESVIASFSAIDSCLNGDVDCSLLNDQCNTGECDENTGECIKVPANEGLGCDDGQYCTEEERCQSGVCTGGGDPCPTGTTCLESSDTCEDNCTDNDGDTYAIEGDSCGAVDCDDANRDVHPGATEVCNGVDDNCASGIDETGDALCDNGLYCDGQETCGGNSGCQSGSLPCPVGTACNESSDTCPVDCTDNDDDGYAIEGGDTCGPVDCDDNDGNNHPENTEVCDGQDNDCDDKVDETFEEKGDSCTVGKGECRRTGSMVCNASGTGTTCDATAGSPKSEICDGKDNDDDGNTDETGDALCDNGEYCDGKETCTGTGGCKDGSPPCSAGETCNEKTDTCEDICTDNDDDGYASEGGDTCGPVDCDDNDGNNHPENTEVCDGQDNDCDDKVDETFEEKGDSCTVGKGECRRTGSMVCNASGTGTTCDATAGSPKSEICDGKDNDCDGNTDENLKCGPDLKISAIKQNGDAKHDGDQIIVPIIVEVKNQGTEDAVNFKTSTSFTTKSSGPYAVAFTVKGQSDTWYPWTKLAGGASKTFEGVLTFNYWYEGDTVNIRALADSCSGDEFISDPPCRVDESDEKNNESSSISVTLPYYYQ